MEDYQDIVAIIRRKREFQAPHYATLGDSVAGEMRRIGGREIKASTADKERQTREAIDRFIADNPNTVENNI